MDQVCIGDSDLAITPLALGCNVFAWTADEAESFRILDAFLDAGGNHLDTADMYPAWAEGREGGESEEIIGRWLTRSGKRSSVVIATKVGKSYSSPGLNGQQIIDGAEASLRRLGVDAIDLYYAHADDPDTPLEESLAAFDSLVQAGKVRWIAASNYSGERLRDARGIQQLNNWSGYVALQQHYNLMHRNEYEQGARDAVADLGMVSLPYYALASGFLSGKYRSTDDLTGERAPRASLYMNEQGLQVLQSLEGIAKQHEVEMATVALAWLRQQPTVAAPIASASRAEQVPSLMASLALTLDESELAALDHASA
jgi:aryl-alcohol dehydrogenase-like predicted oxidoreductase